MADRIPPRLSLRIVLDGAMIGPGKIALLSQIHVTGSISAAGRAMGMSYKRAWSLVEEMNAAFRLPLVTRSRGGTGGGGAQVTAAGAEVMARYQAVIAAAETFAAGDLAALDALVADMSGRTDRLPSAAPESDMSTET